MNPVHVPNLLRERMARINGESDGYHNSLGGRVYIGDRKPSEDRALVLPYVTISGTSQAGKPAERQRGLVIATETFAVYGYVQDTARAGAETEAVPAIRRLFADVCRALLEDYKLGQKGVTCELGEFGFEADRMENMPFAAFLLHVDVTYNFQRSDLGTEAA